MFPPTQATGLFGDVAHFKAWVARARSVREVEARRYENAERVADALAWVGRDRASWRLRFGERLLKDRNFTEARRQLRRSDALDANAEARLMPVGRSRLLMRLCVLSSVCTRAVRGRACIHC